MYWGTQSKRDAQAAIIKAKARTFLTALSNSKMPVKALESVYVHFMSRHDSAMARQLVKAFGAFDFSGALHDGYTTVT